jgi:hypothetical protein
MLQCVWTVVHYCNQLRYLAKWKNTTFFLLQSAYLFVPFILRIKSATSGIHPITLLVTFQYMQHMTRYVSHREYLQHSATCPSQWHDTDHNAISVQCQHTQCTFTYLHLFHVLLACAFLCLAPWLSVWTPQRSHGPVLCMCMPLPLLSLTSAAQFP